MKEITIEVGLKAPSVRAKRERNKRLSEAAKEAILKLQVGDSFLTDAPTALAAYAFGKLNGLRLIQRKQSDGQVRAWRVAEQPAATEGGGK